MIEHDTQPRDEVAMAAQLLQRKQAGLLVLLGVVGVVAVMPYAFALQADQLAEVIKRTGASRLSLALVSCMQSAALVLVSVFAGLWAAQRVGLRAPVTAAMARGESAWPELRRFMAGAVGLGLLSGAATLLLDARVFNPRMPELRVLNEAALAHHSIWKAALACLYGGFTEEILMRLLFLSLLSLGLAHLWRLISGAKTLRAPWAVLWTANLLAAVLFGLGHLPAAAALVKLTPLLVTRTLVLNGVVGLVCGYLYMRRGLEAAMVAHLSADVVLHLVAPALVQSGMLGL
jgi:hypothetical protein